MIKLKEVVVVEGKYDKIKLSSLLDATIIETDGFKIFSNAEKAELLRLLAKKCGLIIMTDSDFAGFKIRNHLKNLISEGNITDVYIPEIIGKEKRKPHPSKEGFLGVEGVSLDIIESALEKAGVTGFGRSEQKGEPITKYDLYSIGLCGKKDSKAKRTQFLLALNLPSHLSTNSLLDVLSSLYTRDEFLSKFNELSIN